MKNILLTTLIMVLSMSIALANTIRDDFASTGMGVRSASMGSAFTAVADDPTAILYNPAGLTASKTIRIQSNVTSVFGMANSSQITVSSPFGAGALGLGYLHLGADNIKRTDDSGVLLGKFDYGDTLYAIGYAQKFADISLGANFKYIAKNAGSQIARGYGLDLGLLYQVGVIRTGLNLTNIGNTSIGNDVYQQDYRIGLAYTGISSATISVDYYQRAILIGGEVWLFDILSLQAGLSHNNFNIGCGLAIGDITISIGYINHDLGQSLRAGLEIGL